MTVLTAAIPAAEKERKVLFENLYKKVFPSVVRFVRQHNGTLHDASDVFQDALVIFYEKQQEGSRLVETQEAYLAGIARHLWYRRFGKERSEVALEDADIIDSLEDTAMDREQKSLLRFLEVAGKKCMELLRAAYYHRQGPEQIKERFGYGSVRSATVAKFKCIEKVREAVKQKQVTYDDFTY